VAAPRLAPFDGADTSIPGPTLLADAGTLVQPDGSAALVVIKEAPARPAPVDAAPDEKSAATIDGGRPQSERPRVRPARRRPALFLAAALVGALSFGLVAADEPAVQASTATASSSVSVAEQLGITVDPDAPITAADTARLEELVASRNERDAEQAAAAKTQADADRKAAEAAKAAAKAKAAAAAEAARPDAVLPVPGGRLTSGFGGRWGRLHAGIDLAAPMMTPELAVMDGVVLEAGPASGYGNVVYLQHKNGDVTAYGHMEKILVQPGQVVRAGETIALLGNRGRSTGPHLHFEVHVGGLDGPKIDPLPWMRDRGIDI
jgi:murein DD-endopeptidase MepM/ murein hydrolase activator NlpD